MRVLHLTPEMPFGPGAGGGRSREFFLCRRLVESGHEVLNISPVASDEMHLAQSLRDVGVENWGVLRPDSRIREAIMATVREPLVLGAALRMPVRALEMRVFEIALRPLIARAVRDWHPDVVVIGHDMAAGWVVDVPSTLPAVLTLHNLTWRWYLSRSLRHHVPLSALLRTEASRYRQYVLSLIPRFNAVVCLSTVEADELRSATGIPVTVIPCGVDTEQPPAPEQVDPPRLLFTGTLNYGPNSQGIVWFVDNVWPQVVASIPDARLDIVGRNPPRSVVALAADPRIDVVGPVAEMGPYFARANVVIVPILTGAGIRVKIIEAMAAGRAIVSTSLGSEGLPYVQPDQHLLVADKPEQFARATIRLLRDGALRARVASAGRALAELRYDWRQLSDEQERVIVNTVEHHTS